MLPILREAWWFQETHVYYFTVSTDQECRHSLPRTLPLGAHKAEVKVLVGPPSLFKALLGGCGELWACVALEEFSSL